MGYPLYVVLDYTRGQLDRAIGAEDWDAARAWLRPGIAYSDRTYNEYEREYPVELGETARQGRADGLRQEFWCLMVKKALPWLRLRSHQPYMEANMTFCVLRQLEQINRKYPLERVALDDDRFGDGTVLEVWLKDLSPHLTHRRPEFAQYESELRARSPLPFDARLALAQGLHSRLGVPSPFNRLTSELVQIIANSDTERSRRATVRLLPDRT